MVVLNANNAWEVAERLVNKTVRTQEKRLKFITQIDEFILTFDEKDPIVEHLSMVRRQFMAFGCNHSTHDMTHDIYVSTLRILEIVASNNSRYKAVFDAYCKLF
jgi:hypothetical protein